MNEIIDAFDLLVVNNCLTPREALEKAWVAGHRAAVKELEKDKTSLVVIDGKTASARK